MIIDKGQELEGRLVVIILNSLSFIDHHKLIVKIWPPHDYWMYLWKKYGDSNIPPFPEDILPPVAADTSSDEITPPPPVAPTNLVTATDALDSVHQDTICLPTLPSCEDFLSDIAQLFVESHIEYVGDILDDIHLLFEADTPSFAAVTDS